MVTRGTEDDSSVALTRFPFLRAIDPVLPLDRRQNCRVAQVDAGVFDRRLRRPHGRSENRQAGLHVFELLRRRDASGRQSALARDLQFGALERCPIALESGLALGKLRPQRAVIEGEQKISLFDLLPFLEMNLGNLPVHAGLDHHRRDRLDVADRGDLDRSRQSRRRRPLRRADSAGGRAGPASAPLSKTRPRK